MNTEAQDATAREWNLDGLVGPTHHFAGVAPGNLASRSHAQTASHPRAAALQGLAKMNRLRSAGVPQAILPPQFRPNIAMLRRLGFRGSDAQVLASAASQDTRLLSQASSGSSMWTANAATVCPSADAADGRVHFTPANLVTAAHRAAETGATAAVLRQIFADEHCFAHHDPIPGSSDMGDEGAANHTRFGHTYVDPGAQLFVYGVDPDDKDDADARPRRFPARQSAAASRAVARLHRLSDSRTVFARQHPDAIDAGVFHNDVIAVGHRNLLFAHELAFAEKDATYDALRSAAGNSFTIAEVTSAELSLHDAVATYLFNSQIVTDADGRTVLVAPQHCEQHRSVQSVIERCVSRGVFDDALYVDVSQSMNNGGGPACLRLRVILSPEQEHAMSPAVVLTDQLSDQLTDWIERHYRETLHPSDLGDPALLDESCAAMEQLESLLKLSLLNV